MNKDRVPMIGDAMTTEIIRDFRAMYPEADEASLKRVIRLFNGLYETGLSESERSQRRTAYRAALEESGILDALKTLPTDSKE